MDLREYDPLEPIDLAEIGSAENDPLTSHKKLQFPKTR
jgi:hypothetical protein